MIGTSTFADVRILLVLAPALHGGGPELQATRQLGILAVLVCVLRFQQRMKLSLYDAAVRPHKCLGGSGTHR